MKGGVEAGDLRQTGQQVPDDLDAAQVVRLVQRRERRERLDPRHDLVVDPDRAGKIGPAVDDPVADRDQVGSIDLPEHGLEQDPQGSLVRSIGCRWAATVRDRAAPVPHRQLEPGSHALDLPAAARRRRWAANIVDRAFDARRAGIDGQDQHIAHRSETPCSAAKPERCVGKMHVTERADNRVGAPAESDCSEKWNLLQCRSWVTHRSSRFPFSV